MYGLTCSAHVVFFSYNHTAGGVWDKLDDVEWSCDGAGDYQKTQTCMVSGVMIADPCPA